MDKACKVFLNYKYKKNQRQIKKNRFRNLDLGVDNLNGRMHLW